jgi:hypothetical protein
MQIQPTPPVSFEIPHDKKDAGKSCLSMLNTSWAATEVRTSMAKRV